MRQEIESRIGTLTYPTIGTIKPEITPDAIGDGLSESTIDTTTAAATERPAICGEIRITGATGVTPGATLTTTGTIDMTSDVIHVATSGAIATRNLTQSSGRLDSNREPGGQTRGTLRRSTGDRSAGPRRLQ
jgi:hypothetical protein